MTKRTVEQLAEIIDDGDRCSYHSWVLIPGGCRSLGKAKHLAEKFPEILEMTDAQIIEHFPKMADGTYKKEEAVNKTPCTKLGYKVGDTFEFTEDIGWAGVSKGQRATLFEDDESQSPLFKTHPCKYKLAAGAGGFHLNLSKVRKVEMTPAEKKGLKVGDTVIRTVDNAHCRKGTLAKFVRDDKSQSPEFALLEGGRLIFLDVDRIEKYVEPAPEPIPAPTPQVQTLDDLVKENESLAVQIKQIEEKLEKKMKYYRENRDEIYRRIEEATCKHF